jgi:hypothetical protein
MHFFTIYVMRMSGAISTPLSLIQLVHGYKELTLTSLLSFVTTMIWNPTKREVKEPILDALPLLREKGILFVNTTKSISASVFVTCGEHQTCYFLETIAKPLHVGPIFLRQI